MKLFQACFDMKDESTVHRETRALNAAKKELNIEGEIITPGNFLRFIDQL